MNAVLDAFETYLQTQDRSPHTISAYRSDVTGFFAWLSAKLQREVAPVEVTIFDVKKYRDHLVGLDRKPATVNRKLASLRVFFDWIVAQGEMASNPAAPVQGVEQGQRAPKALSEEEVYKLQRAAAEQRQLAEAKAGAGNFTPAVVRARRDEALVTLLLYTGLRVGEAADLRRTDVQITERKGNVIVRAGKGRKYREVPIHKEVRDALTAYLDARDDKNEALFMGQRGPLGERGMQMALAVLGEAAKVEVTPHVLRHTFGTRLLREAKTDLVTVAALMGHKSIATTMIYTQPNETDKREAIERLE